MIVRGRCRYLTEAGWLTYAELARKRVPQTPRAFYREGRAVRAGVRRQLAPLTRARTQPAADANSAAAYGLEPPHCARVTRNLRSFIGWSRLHTLAAAIGLPAACYQLKKSFDERWLSSPLVCWSDDLGCYCGVVACLGRDSSGCAWSLSQEQWHRGVSATLPQRRKVPRGTGRFSRSSGRRCRRSTALRVHRSTRSSFACFVRTLSRRHQRPTVRHYCGG